MEEMPVRKHTTETMLNTDGGKYQVYDELLSCFVRYFSSYCPEAEYIQQCIVF